MGKSNRTCIVCKTKYEYCSNCDKTEPLWKNCFDTENCKNIFDAVSNFNAGSINKKQFNERISMCDLSNKNNFKKGILDVINKNMTTRKSRAKNVQKTEGQEITDIIEENINEDK